MITPEQKKLWVEALRSGKYKQGSEFLCARGNYCCLGVLAEVLGIAYSESADGIKRYDGRDSRLSEDILSRNQQLALMSMNDGTRHDRPHSFATIASYIEENL